MNRKERIFTLICSVGVVYLLKDLPFALAADGEYPQAVMISFLILLMLAVGFTAIWTGMKKH